MRHISWSSFLRKCFWNIYDHLGRLIMLNVLWFLLNLPWWIGGSVFFFWGQRLVGGGQWLSGILLMEGGLLGMLLSPPTMGLFSACRPYVEYRPREAGKLLRGTKHSFWRSQTVGLLWIMGTVLLSGNLGFYLSHGGKVGLFLAALMGWALLFWLLTALFLFPLLTFQNTPIGTTFKRSALLVLGDPWFALFLLAAAGGLLILSVITGVGLLIFGPSWIAILLNTAFRELLKGYERAEGKPLEEEEERGWRDLIRPWRE